jgi:glycosyltransferase involved in cell wall biosynthesis
MTPHHVLTRLARYFHVVWSEPAHEWKNFRKSIGKRRALAGNGDFSLPPGFHMYVPEPWYPAIHYSDWMRRFTFERRLKHAARRLKREGCRKLVLYLWHPQFEPALFSLGFDLKLYHIDDEYSFSPTPPSSDPRELRILENVDQVFVVSPALLERKGAINPHTAFVPEGVDYKLYATPIPEPDDLRRIPHPRIGYTGNLKVQLDWPLLRELAMRHREWQFVFVGPVNPQHGIEGFISEMSQWSNVHFLGQKPVTVLASYPQHFDVGIMPYRVDAYTNNIYPLKLHEYLASGRPVVSSPIRSIQEFSDVVTLAETSDDWSRALADALQPAASFSKAIAIRRQIAREHDWETLIDSLARTICERLGPEYAKQFAETKPCESTWRRATNALK